MARRCCCHGTGVKKGSWTEEEDKALVEHIQKRGGHVGSWRAVPKASGLNRCGKSCRLRWTNYLRPDIKRGNFTEDEERLIISLHAALGNKWSTIATHLEGRTDNEIKNFWNTRLRKKLLSMGVDPVTHQQLPPDQSHHHHLDGASAAILPDTLLWAAAAARLGGLDTGALRQAQLLQQLLQAMRSNNDTTNLINNLAAANAMLNSVSSIVPNLLIHQDQMNMLSGANYLQPGYMCNVSSFAEQDVVQQLINAPGTGTSSSAATEPADQHCIAAAEFALHGVSTAVDRPPLQELAGLLPEPTTELPGLCSLESDSFWRDILEEYRV